MEDSDPAKGKEKKERPLPWKKNARKRLSDTDRSYVTAKNILVPAHKLKGKDISKVFPQ